MSEAYHWEHNLSHLLTELGAPPPFLSLSFVVFREAHLFPKYPTLQEHGSHPQSLTLQSTICTHSTACGTQG